MNQLDRAAQALEESIEIAKKVGATDAVAGGLNHLAVIAIMRGRLPEAIAYARAAVDTVDVALDKSETISTRMQLPPVQFGEEPCG